MIRTGVDWSGDPGDPRRNAADSGILVIAACSLDEKYRPQAEAAMADLRSVLAMRSDQAFKYMKSREVTREQFFRVLAGTAVEAAVIRIDKQRIWDDTYLGNTTGPQRIVQSVTRCLVGLPDELIAGQVLLVDGKRQDKRLLDDLRQALRTELRRSSRKTFRRVNARPDDRSDALLIQAADMVAGDLRALGTERSVAARFLGNALTIVEW